MVAAHVQLGVDGVECPAECDVVMRITGERPVEGVTPDGLVALHRAGYLEVESRIGAGRVLDIGCGVGFGMSLLEGPDREVFGVDYDFSAAEMALRRQGSEHGQVICGDGAELGLRTGSFDWVCSSHIIEHFLEPEGHVAEIARVLRPEGRAFVFTPNPPSDLENPFHVHLFSPQEFRSILERHFAEVWVGGHDATQEVKDDFAARRATAARLLRLDVFDLRHRVPRSWYVAAYSMATRLFYRLQASRHAGGVTSITPAMFHAVDQVDRTTLSLFGIASRPRGRAAASG